MTAIAKETAVERVRRDLHCAVDNMRVDLDRVEILSAALNAFSRPVPAYEPAFCHLRDAKLSAHEI